ncbi:MAG: prepilin-type N-terminal cleavage/methylation domain-containing protein [Candidatus Riflebacteria bacterium]|nr:prepilin-type N-terminal cleavage/methylation domain-containing protein [Candidatus Riflebacteria bacterium]
MKSSLPIADIRRSRGFTLVEIVISATVLATLFLVVTLLFRHLSDSYRLTTWKQEHLQQAQSFWNIARKNLEEAADLIAVSSDLVATSSPLLYRSVSQTGLSQNGINPSGPLLRWEKSHILTSGTLEYRVECQVSLNDRSVAIQALPPSTMSAPSEELISTPKTILTDVDAFVIQTTPIKLDADRGEYLEAGVSSSTVGTLVEISIRFKPPSNSGLPSQIEITQNNKFKLAVDAASYTNPADFPAFP